MQQEYIGFDCIDNLAKIMSNSMIHRVLIFCGKNSFEKVKESVLRNITCQYTLYNDFEVNPKLSHVKNAISTLDGEEYQMLLAVGGGSVIDFAKLYKYYSKSSTPLVAIPTTAGTGSEATQFAVMYIDGVKHSIDDISIFPEYSIVDSQMLLNSPKYLKACSAIDAFCQAIESYWSVASTEKSKVFAKKAIVLADKNIREFVNGNTVDAATNMAKSSNLAGKAINISRTTAAHALSYALTSDYNIPHGHAVALSMIDLFEANLKVDKETCQDERGVDYVLSTLHEILEILQTSDIRSYWQSLLESIGLETSFKKLQITNKEEIFKSVNQERLKNNPKNISDDLQNFWMS